MKKWFLLSASVFCLMGCHHEEENVAKSTRKVLINTENKASVVQEEVIKKSDEPVKIVEFFDFACGHCKSANETLKTLKQFFGDKITIEQKHFPLRPETFFAAEASECARRQGQFENYKDEIFENFGVYSPKKMEEIARTLELDMEAFKTCIKSGATKQYVETHVSEANVLGVHGTPFFLINDQIQIPGNLPQKTFKLMIQKIIDGELE